MDDIEADDFMNWRIGNSLNRPLTSNCGRMTKGTENDTNTEVQFTQSQLYCARAIVYIASLGCLLKPTNSQQ